jgi:hypothetical protein
MIVYRLPPRSVYKKCPLSFRATFNNPTIGKYDFSAAPAVVAFETSENTVFLIERISTSATIAEGTFLQNVEQPLALTFKLRSTGEVLFSQPLPMLLYYTNAEFSGWLQRELKNDAILCSLTGILGQNADLVGIPQIDFLVALDVYRVDLTDYQKLFRGAVEGHNTQW